MHDYYVNSRFRFGIIPEFDVWSAELLYLPCLRAVKTTRSKKILMPLYAKAISSREPYTQYSVITFLTEVVLWRAVYEIPFSQLRYRKSLTRVSSWYPDYRIRIK